MKKAALTVLLVLFVDQLVKVYIKTHFFIGESLPIFGSWSYLLFIENEGMAFGWKFFGTHGKLALSIFRVIAAAGIGYYLIYIIKRKAPSGLIVCFSLIFAGAVGNIIDSAFYGLFFTESTMIDKAVFAPGSGYASFLHGKVVDMLYFPMVTGQYPDWSLLPESLRGTQFIFFRPVFNLADASITTGVLVLLFFQKRLFQYQTVPSDEIPDDDSVASERRRSRLNSAPPYFDAKAVLPSHICLSRSV